MKSPLALDLQRLKSRAYHRAEWAEGTLRRYHAVREKLGDAVESQLQSLYDWMFVPPTLWPFHIEDVLVDCLATLEAEKLLNSRQRLLIDLLPETPDEQICATVAAHEHHVESGSYEDLVNTPAKFSQRELVIRSDPQLQEEWKRIKAVFKIEGFRDGKGIIRRTMAAERNMRPWFSVNPRRRSEVFRAAFDTFCLRWNLYGMQHDEPLVLKLAVNITPFGTMIHIPAYWSFDQKRDIRWDAIAALHRARVPGRQGAGLAEGFAQRKKDAIRLQRLDEEVRRLGLKGAKRHEFLCAGLGWVVETSQRRLSRLRAEFKAVV